MVLTSLICKVQDFKDIVIVLIDYEDFVGAKRWRKSVEYREGKRGRLSEIEQGY